MAPFDPAPGHHADPPRDAATLVVVRDAPAGGVEVFCVERHKAGFLGGAVVFPGGKLDEDDLDPRWQNHATALRATSTPIARDGSALRGLAIAACREALEEAAILPVAGGRVAHPELLEWRALLVGATARGPALRSLLTARALRLDLAALHPLGRWVTPISEPRRFDTRFFLFVADAWVKGEHDDRETTASFWATPSCVLASFEAALLQLAPPTHRTLEILATARDAAAAIAVADGACLEPICPELVPHEDPRGDTVALVLPGDPEHSIGTPRAPGRSRYVLRGGRFLPEDGRRT